MRPHARESGQLRDLVLRINAMLSRTYLLTTFVDAEENWMGAVQVGWLSTDRSVAISYLAHSACRRPPVLLRVCRRPCYQCATLCTRPPIRPGANHACGTHSCPVWSWTGVARFRGRCCQRTCGICGSILERAGGCNGL